MRDFVIIAVLLSMVGPSFSSLGDAISDATTGKAHPQPYAAPTVRSRASASMGSAAANLGRAGSTGLHKLGEAAAELAEVGGRVDGLPFELRVAADEATKPTILTNLALTKPLKVAIHSGNDLKLGTLADLWVQSDGMISRIEAVRREVEVVHHRIFDTAPRSDHLRVPVHQHIKIRLGHGPVTYKIVDSSSGFRSLMAEYPYETIKTLIDNPNAIEKASLGLGAVMRGITVHNGIPTAGDKAKSILSTNLIGLVTGVPLVPKLWDGVSEVPIFAENPVLAVAAVGLGGAAVAAKKMIRKRAGKIRGAFWSSLDTPNSASMHELLRQYDSGLSTREFVTVDVAHDGERVRVRQPMLIRNTTVRTNELADQINTRSRFRKKVGKLLLKHLAN